MKFKFDSEKAEELIRQSGLKKGSIIEELETSTTTFGRWMKEETPIPLVKAAELISILNTRVECTVEDLYKEIE